MRNLATTALLFIATLTIQAGSPASSPASSLDGLWDATVNVRGVEIPFRFEIAGDGTQAKASFFNGEERFASSSGKIQDGVVVFDWDYMASRLEARVKDDTLEGKYGRAGRDEKSLYEFHARRFKPVIVSGEGVPSIAGVWIIPTKSPKGESAWRFIVRQSGAEVSAAILRVDGDTGALTGTYRDGKFVLSHFSGARPALMEVSLVSDGSLEIAQNGKKLTAVRSSEASAKGVPEPTDPSKYTSVKDPTKPFEFSFPDLNGKLVSNTDPRFRGKVVLIDLMGSWCPNCHDETPYLVELYNKYHSRGLEIVALSFEEESQVKDPARLRAFVKKYGIEYTVLLGGETSSAKEKLSQAENWNAWPTTFFIGRDGLVRGAHAGFPSVGSGELFTQAKEEFAAKVEKLLVENEQSSRR